jgi:hypothetical protein
MDEMNLLRDRADAQPAPRPEAVASALDRLHSAAREPRRAARRPIRLPGSRRWFRPVPRLMAAVVAAAVVATVMVTTTVIARGPGEEQPITFGAVGDLASWHAGDPEIVVFLCKDDSPFVLCGGGGFAVDDGGSGPPPNPILGGKATTSRDKAAIERTLGAMPQVEAISFVNKQEAYANLLRMDQKLSETSDTYQKLSKTLDPEDMTESFTLKMKPGTDWDTVIETAKTLQGVSAVLNRKCLTENAQEIAQGNKTLCAPGGYED